MTKGRFDPMPPSEAAALGRALVASIRGEELSPAERATLDDAQSSPEESAPMPILEQDELLASFARGADAEIQVSWRRFRGSAGFLDLRRFERGRGGLRATKQGVTIRGRELGQLLAVLVQATQRVEPEPASLELVGKRSARG